MARVYRTLQVEGGRQGSDQVPDISSKVKDTEGARRPKEVPEGQIPKASTGGAHRG